eukprot:SAG11_NODE_176_length_13359_cov_10.862142_7_plen_60_part_00
MLPILSVGNSREHLHELVLDVDVAQRTRLRRPAVNCERQRTLVLKRDRTTALGQPLCTS